MGIQQTAIEPHWNYMLAIERDVERLSRYVEFDQRNFGCFSIEIARILLATAAEVDVVCKQICQNLNGTTKAQNIHEFQKEIVAGFPNLPQFEVVLPRFDLPALCPWKEWSTSSATSPGWWKAYNKTKHERHAQYNLANLDNALNAVAGLFVIVLHLYADKARTGELIPAARLLRAGEKHVRGINNWGYEYGICYDV
jgi:hypothetical protein